jgi:hypothetical protein
MHRTRTTIAIAATALGLWALPQAFADDSNGEDAKAPADVMTDTAAAMAALTSYHAHDSVSDGGVTISYTRDVDQVHRRVLLTAKSGSARFDVIVAGKIYYKRANAAYLRQFLPPKSVPRFASKWFRGPLENSDYESLQPSADPAVNARCFNTHLGTLTKDSSGPIGGQPAVIIRDAGDAPGGVQRKFYVAATGAPLMLSELTTGKVKRGGEPIRECHETVADLGAKGAPEITTSFSRFNAPLAIKTPKKSKPFPK